MNVYTIPKKIFYSTDLIGGAFFRFLSRSKVMVI